MVLKLKIMIFIHIFITYLHYFFYLFIKDFYSLLYLFFLILVSIKFRILLFYFVLLLLLISLINFFYYFTYLILDKAIIYYFYHYLFNQSYFKTTWLFFIHFNYFNLMFKLHLVIIPLILTLFTIFISHWQFFDCFK